MTLSREARLMSGIILIAIPSVMYGGITLLGILTDSAAGVAPGDLGTAQLYPRVRTGAPNGAGSDCGVPCDPSRSAHA
ncbi:MAG TPA: hypothetical protein VMN39_06050 [Longimicrobiaceae bacterium]|nr:hypothetical protein [Longimicrobiaceae bacterium]